MNNEIFPLDIAPKIVQDFVGCFQFFTEAPDEFLASVPLFVGGVLAGRQVQFNNQYNQREHWRC